VRNGPGTVPIGVTATDGWVDEVEQHKNRNQSRVRAKSEHPFLVLKRLFCCAMVHYQRLFKKAERLTWPAPWSICSSCAGRYCVWRRCFYDERKPWLHDVKPIDNGLIS
jgi:hypothetical protein